MSFIVEALSSALGAPRAEVSATLDQLESRLSAMRGDLQRRVGAALGRDQSTDAAADEVLAVAASVSDPTMDKLLLKLLASAGGVFWGVAVGSAALNAGGTIAIGFGLIALEPVIAMILALAIIFISGHCALSVGREIWSRMNRQIDQLSDA